MTEEAKTEEATEETPKPKRGRPRVQAEPAPKAVEKESKAEEAEETVDSDSNNESEETVNEPDFETSGGHADDKAVNHAVEESNKKEGQPAGRIVSEGEDIEVQTREENGVYIADETVYREVSIMNSKRKTYYLIATEGTPYYKQTTILL